MRNKKGQFKKFSLGFRIYLEICKWYEVRKYIIAAGMWGLLVGSLLGFALFSPKISTPEAVEPIISNEAEEVTPNKDPHDLKPLEYIRIRGQELGFDDYTISKFIRVGKCESSLNPEVKNKTSTAKGIYQIIIGTWDSNKCEGERWDFVDNINCAYKLLESRGFQPWNSSKSCWQ